MELEKSNLELGKYNSGIGEILFRNWRGIILELEKYNLELEKYIWNWRTIILEWETYRLDLEIYNSRIGKI